MSTPERARFEAAFERHHRAVLAYALRRVPIEADAEDVVAETFAVAWRRVDRLPDVEVALPWLLAVARRVLANQHRGTARRFRLALRLQVQPRSAAVITDTPALEALSLLPPDDQELIRLLAWEGLSQAEVGVVLGVSPNAVAIRLHRARRRFTHEMARLGALDVKGSDASRTFDQVEGRMSGRRSDKEHAP